jgi:hypothetical protein
MQLAALSAAQDVNVQILHEHETRLSVNERSIALINSTVLRMGKKVAELSYTLGTDELILQLGFTLDSVFEDSTRILRGMNNALADNCLSPDFVKTSKMTAALLRLENSMQREGYKLGLETFDDICRCQTSTLVWNNGTLNIYLHIPAYKIDSRLRLLEHKPVPLILPEIVPQQQGKGYRNMAMYVQPLHTILAIQTGGSAFKVFTRAELGACQVLGGTYFCPNSNILDKRIKTNCVLGLFNRDQEVITAHCPWISIAATDFNIQLGANRFLLYLANSKEVQLVCGKESATRSFHGLKQLTVPANCQLFTESNIMEGQRNFSLSVDNLHREAR